MSNTEDIQKAFNNFNNKITLSGSKRDNLIMLKEFICKKATQIKNNVIK